MIKLFSVKAFIAPLLLQMLKFDSLILDFSFQVYKHEFFQLYHIKILAKKKSLVIKVVKRNNDN